MKSYQIAIEGNDGAGKSSLIKLLSKYLKSRGYKVRVLRYNMSFITLPAIKEGKKRKFSPELNTLLHYLSIKDQQERLAKNVDFIIWDRHKYSVYSRGKARNTDQAVLDFVLNDCASPDLTIYLDIDPNLSLKRLNGAINYWEAGLDIYNNLTIKEAFQKFQSSTRKEFIKILSPSNNTYLLNVKEGQSIRETLRECINIINVQRKGVIK